MRSAVHKDSHHSLCDLKEAITCFIRNISHIELVQVFTDKMKWVDACLQDHGDHFGHLL